MIGRFGAVLMLGLMAMGAHAQETAEAAATRTLRQALGAISQADGQGAKGLIATLNIADLPKDKQAQATCMAGRLAGAAGDPATAEGVISGTATRLYRRYWRDAVLGTRPVAEAEDDLRVKLAQALQLPVTTGWDGVETALEAAIRKQGFGVLLGQTGRLRELMIWTSERSEDRTVTLPEGAHKVRIIYLDRFSSQGWTRFLSCDAIGTGGWAKPEGLYAVVPAYPSLDHELFVLSFLGHETQHFADYQRFPGLKPWELEYRAKLVELVYARAISPMLLRGFASAAGSDPDDSHAYANGRVIADLKARLGVADLTAVPLADIQGAALAALLADTRGRGAG